MKVEVARSIVFPAPRERVWQLLTDIDLLPTFPGWGPIPGIAEARWISGAGAVGGIREVKNRDGTKHKEELMALENLRRIEDRIYDLESPLRLMVRDVRDEFVLSPEGTGTRLDRKFTFELSSMIWWLPALVIKEAIGKAVSRHHQDLATRL